MSGKPNLFGYAPGELSQDAFLCWLIRHASYPQRPAMHACAREFVAFLYNQAHPHAQVSGRDVEDVRDLEKQKFKIDVFFRACVAGREVAFAIEDKVDTSEHSQQLDKYNAAMDAHGIPKQDRVCIYLKTGFVFGKDRLVEKKGWRVVGPEPLLDFFQGFEIESEIYTDYRDHLESRVTHVRQGLTDLLQQGNPTAFQHDFAQATYLEKLVEAMDGAPAPERVYGERNRDGSPWMQCRIRVKDKVFPGDHGETLFYRIDKRMHPERKEVAYYLSLRQYAWVKGHDEARKAKLKQLRHYRETFGRIVESHPSPLKFSRPVSDNQGANESEIATVFFGPQTNSVKEVLLHLPAIHRAFIRAVGP